MIFSEIHIQNFRLFDSASFVLHPRFNIITGPNGSGKTSFLEILYLLTTTRSFRSREVKTLIREDFSSFYLRGHLSNKDTIELSKSLSHNLSFLKINSKICQITSVLLKLIPSVLCYLDIFQILDASPQVRRNALDWGMFHVKHSYLDILKQYHHVLKQRNALLKGHYHDTAFEPWDKILASLGEAIHEERAHYIQSLQPVFEKNLLKLMTVDCSIFYEKGWGKKDTKKTLLDVLVDARVSDRQYQYTRYGPHQSDLIFQSKNKKTKHYLSRGQQKIILFCFKMSQAELIQVPCIYLLDDIIAELDAQHVQRLLLFLSEYNAQCFLTGHDAHSIAPYLHTEFLEIPLDRYIKNQ